MRFNCTVRMNTAAFGGEGAEFEANMELAEILETLRRTIARTPDLKGGEGGKLRDSNGNTVGEWKVEP